MNKYFINKLSKIYPDKKITNFLDDNLSLYQNISRYSRESGMEIKTYLNELGFEYITKPRGIQSRGFDFNTAMLLKGKYGFTGTDFSSWLNVTPQGISLYYKKKSQNINWICNSMLDDESFIVEQMVENKTFTLIEDSLMVYIRTDYTNPCVVFVNFDHVKVYFNFPTHIDELFKSEKIDSFDEIEFYLISKFEEAKVMGRRLLKIEEESVKIRFKAQSKKRNLSNDDYSKLFGYDGTYDQRMITDNQIISMIKEYVIKENVIYFPVHENTNYHNFTNRASRSNMSIGEYFEFFGFVQSKERTEESIKERKNQLIEEIKLYIVGDENNVFIRSDSNFYRKIYAISKLRKISINELLFEYGFKRIYDINKQSELKAFENKNDNNSLIDRERIIQDLEKIQGGLETSTSITDKKSRSQSLVKKLKQLYEHRCQICSELFSIPQIIKENGTFYVEMHHIKGLSNYIGTIVELEGIEDDPLDHYKNAIIVCTFHHKVLHFHEGGFDEIIEQDGTLYFISKKETLLKIETNYHLSFSKE
jgi:hypothetical protein